MSLQELTERVRQVLTPSDPAAVAQRLVEKYLDQTQGSGYWNTKPRDHEAGREILDLPLEKQIVVIHQLTIRIDRSEKWNETVRMEHLRTQLFARNLPYTDSDIERLLHAAKGEATHYSGGCAGSILRHVERFHQSAPLTPSMLTSLEMINEIFENGGRKQKLKAKVMELLSRAGADEPDAGEAWADAALADLNAMTPERRAAWSALFAHAATADSSKPSVKWLKEAETRLAKVGSQGFVAHVTKWFELVKIPLPQQPMIQTAAGEGFVLHAKDVDLIIKAKNFPFLKGLIWCCAKRSEPKVARSLAKLAEAASDNDAYFSIGPWSKSVRNAAIWALGQMPDGVGVGPLARLRTKLRNQGALKLIASAIESAAAKAGMSVDELEDLAVPTGGLDADGTRRETFGDEGAATLTLDAKNAKTNLQWFGADGNPRKAVPAGVKNAFAAEVKALKAAEEEIRQALAAQAARLDHAILEERTWPYALWRERYLAHPILGNLTRRLIWTFDSQPGLPVGDTVVDIAGSPLPSLTDETTVRLWHPLGSSPETVMRWRDTLESRGLVQPFKQAHREVYLLTDAELNTRVYSNRFAAHILRQHQFNSLCVLRGWRNSLRLMVDDTYPPATRDLPQWNLRAEFWIEGIGDNYGVDTNDTGTYLRVATDQVRFYRTDAPVNYAYAGGGGYAADRRNAPGEPLPLDQVPPLAFSEVMRDVDLFVGVASLGNDPAWADGGPEGRFRDYWREYAFGELAESASTRAAVLTRLLPRLKIAPRCYLEGRFLHVRGDLRTYKIHLGSGNILMEPNDQYLCIVPGRGEDTGDLFLPFEGDRTLAVILSKAFLLADDKRIADLTITRQIGVT